METWNGWKVVRLIGKGAFGQVYEIEKDNGFRSALKVITIPHDQSEIEELYLQGMDTKSIRNYYSAEMKSLVEEFRVMYRLRGQSNFVSYEDHEVREHEDGVGGQIFIRMELLTPLQNVINSKSLSENEIIKLGIDICRALEVCEKKHILHRDIKPQNIFVNENGDYKLGDFGVARLDERTAMNLSRKGTYSHMAPEIYHGEPYGHQADIYSLGIVLYQLLNDNREPFLPSGPLLPGDKEAAFAKRIEGSNLPAPTHGSRSLKAAVQKAAAYAPENRYKSAGELLNDLEECMKDLPLRQEFETVRILDKTTEKLSSASSENQKPAQSEEIKEEEKHDIDLGKLSYSEQNNSKRGPMAALAVLIVMVAVLGAVFLRVANEKPETPDNQYIQIPDTVLKKEIQEELGIGDRALIEEDALKLTELSCNEPVADLTGMSYFSELKYLDLNASGGRISDLSPLSRLTKLSELNLSGNQIDDVSPLSGLIQLTELNLSNNEISDLKRLTGLIQLTELNLNNNKIEDMRPLSDLTHLERLFLSNNEISDIRPLTDLTQLKRLDLSSNWISDVSPLSGLAQLTELNLTNNEISDTSPLSGLTQLSEINISGNPIEAQNDSDDIVEEREAQQDTTVPEIDMGAIVQITASSSLSERGMIHSPDRLIDNDVTKAWVEGVNGLGSGEWVRLTFDNTYAINGITISQGFQESRDMYEKNARPSRIRVFCDGYSEEIFLEDAMSAQTFTFHEKMYCDYLVIEILDSYRGKKYEDTVISEILLF